ncbi:hypothetical protein NEOLEDRAFT_937462 [Neolentinus lepideus HHB14362 ss-1]|uniref:Uncharacterized protein n=1 Tax=Neolentinus lepideus HHB14362 ss-1 TaxID=1314782 RepID=A0A165NH46_9AGAM|nr:hypothetical protein NEOLEDRAFT_937462 [Neolentinus lepideus HHB14362 ss-1]
MRDTSPSAIDASYSACADCFRSSRSLPSLLFSIYNAPRPIIRTRTLCYPASHFRGSSLRSTLVLASYSRLVSKGVGRTLQDFCWMNVYETKGETVNEESRGECVWD